MTRHTKEEVQKAARNMKPGGLRDVDGGSYTISPAKKYPGSTPCPLCKTCLECGLIAHDDKPTMHKVTCSKRSADGEAPPK